MKASSFSRSKAVVALALCGFFAMSACSAGDPADVESYQEASAGLTKGTVGAVNGDTDYCDSPSNLCTAGQGDCDASTQCTTGNACATKYGPRYGLSGTTDVCMPASCRNNVQNVGETSVDCGGSLCGPCYPNCSAGTNGSSTFCAQYGSCLCGNGQGNCNATGECQPGLTCSNGKGAQFGFAAKLGLCLKAHCTNKVLDAGETGIDCGGECGACLPTCSGGTPGAVNYCSTCMCSAGQGDCNNTYECETGLVCGSKNGAQFGFSAKTNVCVAAHCANGVQDGTETGVDCGGADCGMCPGVCAGAVGSETYCVGCKCAAGQGDCDASSECVTGLSCGSNQGAKFGFTSSVDICVAPHCINGTLDAASGETDVDCGGECGSCLAAAMDAGTLHACAVYLGGVKCWGYNDKGQLGNGTTTTNPAPGAVTGLGATFTQVAAGAGHSCAVAGGNDVRCWGDGTLGQLGNGGVASSLTQVSVTGEPSSITQISSGGNTTCVLAAGAVWCWGDNSSGQCGGAVGGTKTTPSQVAGITTAVHISVGLAHACAALADGTVRCWGSDSIRQLGDNLRNNTGTPVTAVGVAGAIEVSTGDDHSCALLSGGGVYCWGNNATDRLAIGAALNGGVPSPVNGASGGIHLASSSLSDCIVKSGGTLACWGRGTSGQIGTGSTKALFTTATAVPTLLTGFAGITGGGGSFFCAKNASGVACWGDDNYGELGKGTVALRAIPTNISAAPSAAITSIGAGDLSTCLVAGGATYCFGNNNSGEIGDGTDQQRRTAKIVTGISTATEVSVGSAHACVVLSSGAVSCWGANTYGQLGDGGTTNASTPVTAGAVGVAHIGTGTVHTCALKTNGSVQCWGRSDQGQLGNGSTAQSNTPVTAVAANVIDLGVGQRHSCVVLSGGAVSCWGINNSSQLGDGGTTNQPSPVAVAGLPSAATRVTAGQNHSCAVLASGLAYCWGDNTLGQLGDSTLTSSTTPVQVSGLTGATDIMSWGSTTCALKGNTLYCWGLNSRGQVGNGTIVNVSVPYAHVGLNSLVVAGGRHTCAVRTNNSVRCWGYNDYGQVGDGTSWLFPTPAYVAF